MAHLNCTEQLSKLKNSQVDSPMKFVQITREKDSVSEFSTLKEPQEEFVEKQNDIELIITKGVKVIISPNIDSMKIIKIIELLKDL